MLHITEHKTGLKMVGFISLNTSVFQNQYCMTRSKVPGSICRHCYGLSMENTYRRLHRCLVKNSEELKDPLSDESLSDIVARLKQENKRFIRFNSIGELHGPDNLKNYLDIARALPDSIFGIWSKRKHLFSGVNIPENMTVIYSNPSLDKPITWVPKNFNGVFNVITYQYAIENNILPNCSGKCIDCLKCYRPGKRQIVYELLKSDQTKIKKGIYPPVENVII